MDGIESKEIESTIDLDEEWEGGRVRNHTGREWGFGAGC